MRFYDLFSWDVGGKTLKIKLTLELSFIIKYTTFFLIISPKMEGNFNIFK